MIDQSSKPTDNYNYRENQEESILNAIKTLHNIAKSESANFNEQIAFGNQSSQNQINILGENICHTHKVQINEMYCIPCGERIWEKCIISGLHMGHEISSFCNYFIHTFEKGKEIIEGFKRNYKTIKTLNKKGLAFLNKTKKEVNSEVEKMIDIATYNISWYLRKKANELNDQILNELLLQRDAKEAYKSALKVYPTLSNLKNQVRPSKTLLRKIELEIYRFNYSKNMSPFINSFDTLMKQKKIEWLVESQKLMNSISVDLPYAGVYSSAQFNKISDKFRYRESDENDDTSDDSESIFDPDSLKYLETLKEKRQSTSEMHINSDCKTMAPEHKFVGINNTFQDINPFKCIVNPIAPNSDAESDKNRSIFSDEYKFFSNRVEKSYVDVKGQAMDYQKDITNDIKYFNSKQNFHVHYLKGKINCGYYWNVPNCDKPMFIESWGEENRNLDSSNKLNDIKTDDKSNNSNDEIFEFNSVRSDDIEGITPIQLRPRSKSSIY